MAIGYGVDGSAGDPRGVVQITRVSGTFEPSAQQYGTFYPVPYDC
ncbi:hypothetical protein [Streptomyces mirabilis]